ncbi:hypothetical protein J6TS2_51340 [Heyndrickxia sporothermodurans]|nr:hypothetical protein J6TS2_51340 [Heyndrickxia sporothermodurans]
MKKWNEEAALNNNLHSVELQRSLSINSKSHNQEHEFSEELSDGGERNEIIETSVMKKE